MNEFHKGGNFKAELEANAPEPLSPSLIHEAMKIHFSHSVAAAENEVAKLVTENPKDALILSETFEKMTKDAQVTAHPRFEASVYKDMAVLDQGAALSKLAQGEVQSASIMLQDQPPFKDPSNAANAIASIERLNPANRDLPMLQITQDDLLKQVTADKNYIWNGHQAQHHDQISILPVKGIEQRT